MARKRNTLSRTGYWIFTVSLSTYDVETAIRKYEVDSWPTGRSPVRAGDKALIWAGGAGATHGTFLAMAKILTEPEPTFPLHEELYSEGHLIVAEPHVLLRYLSAPTPEEIFEGLSHFRLQDIEVFGVASHTILPVRRKEWDRITTFLTEWEPPEALSPADEPHFDAAPGVHEDSATPNNALDPLNSAKQRATDTSTAPGTVEDLDPFEKNETHSTSPSLLTLECALTSLEDERQRAERQVVYRSGQRGFRQQIIDLFEGTCAVTGCDVPQVLEAAHIVPYTGPHSDAPSNGLLLRSDIHTLFDRGLIGIDGEAIRIVVSPLLEGSMYGELAGREMIASEAAKRTISRPALEHHRETHALPKHCAGARNLDVRRTKNEIDLATADD